MQSDSELQKSPRSAELTILLSLQEGNICNDPEPEIHNERADKPYFSAENVKLCICWSFFTGYVILEITIHSCYGLEKSVLDDEASGKLLHFPLHIYVAFAEAICRACVVVVLVAMIWECGHALLHSLAHLFRYIQVTYAGDANSPHAVWIPAVFFSIFILVIGTWSVVANNEIPLWALIVCHFMDTLCHAVVTSAIGGFCFELLLAVWQGKLSVFVMNLLTCTDTIENHGVTGAEKYESKDDLEVPPLELECSVSFHDKSRPEVMCARSAIFWSVLVFTISAYLLNQWGDAPKLVSYGLNLLGVFCWAGIVWWLVGCIAHAEHRWRHIGRLPHPASPMDIPVSPSRPRIASESAEDSQWSFFSQSSTMASI